MTDQYLRSCASLKNEEKRAMFQQSMNVNANDTTVYPINMDKEASRELVNNYLENFIKQSYPPSGLREFVNSQLDIPSFDEMCEQGTLIKSSMIKGVYKEVSSKVLGKAPGTTLLSTNNQHFIENDQVWHHFPSEQINDKSVIDRSTSGEGNGQNYKNIGLLRRLIQSRSKFN